ncbi:carboxymuconolactone decarboxylase family protein [Haliea sp. AH-315-K21]|uniref:Gamma carboxymuconolactone decarboxylase n=1 Tax=SAR86 cluster bacterium TaxID=2030880 RepID=A0A2A5C9M3_9GAMM|nr:carboxymuconolactone decarboxylase family protein [Haliea sp. AH-315-K21]PCJ40181.1 MAG: gamma carboxymuconolactone decarboxylase [SAR86 cluster bacterium]
MSDQDYEKGMKVRKDMWGPAGEERVAQASSFNRPFEDLVTEYCFGAVWDREGLDRKTRSMITLAALTVLSKPNQVKVHVMGALANGVSVDEIKEVIMHSAIYGGIPAGVEAITAALEVLDSQNLIDK